jgi:ribonuclease III
MAEPDQDLAAFEVRTGYQFRDRALLARALSHPSRQQDESGADNNQRLEFLGDAVLQLVVSERLHTLYPEEREGDLTRRRATLTRGAFLTALARDFGVHQVLRVSQAERSVGGHERPAALEDAVEALVAAIYLDSDWETVRRVVLGWLGDIDARVSAFEHGANPKGQLQELVQPRHGNNALSYRVANVGGPPHERRFEVEVLIHEGVVGRGVGASKKEAEEAAAREALRHWPTVEE